MNPFQYRLCCWWNSQDAVCVREVGTIFIISISSSIILLDCRESVCKWWVAVQGLNHNEVRTISEKVQEQPEYNSEKEKRIEFSVPTWQVLNGLEVMGYKVVTCGDYMTGEQRHDQKEFVWTLYKNKEDWETSTKWTNMEIENILTD